MDKKYFIGIYWGVRKEDIETCAYKVDATFKLLKNIDSSFAEWYKTSRPKKNEILQTLDLSIEGIKQLLIKGQHYSDVGRRLIEDLGFLFSVKSVKEYRQAHNLSFSCGAYVEPISNNVNINLSSVIDKQHLTDQVILQKIYKGLVDIWQPDWGVIRCDDTDLLLEHNLSQVKLN